MVEKISFSRKYFPTESECMEILKEYGTPIHVQQHCKAVAKTAKAIAIALNNKGMNLNVSLIESAGYLHDVARVHKKHEEVGANYLFSIGLVEVSEVIRDHTKHKINSEIRLLDEEDVLCIADRVVLESRFVGPEERMSYIKNKALKKYGQESEDFLDNIIDRFIKFIAKLEIFIGDKIYNIVPEDVR